MTSARPGRFCPGHLVGDPSGANARRTSASPVCVCTTGDRRPREQLRGGLHRRRERSGAGQEASTLGFCTLAFQTRRAATAHGSSSQFMIGGAEPRTVVEQITERPSLSV